MITLILLVLLTVPAAAQRIVVGGLGIGGYTADQWKELVATASQISVQSGGLPIISGGFAELRGLPDRLERFHELARSRGVQGDIIFAAVADGSRQIGARICRDGSSVVGCAHPTPRAGVLLYLPRRLEVLTLLHEMGHVYGMEHSNDKELIMYPDAYPGQRLSRRYLQRQREFAR